METSDPGVQGTRAPIREKDAAGNVVRQAWYFNSHSPWLGMDIFIADRAARVGRRVDSFSYLPVLPVRARFRTVAPLSASEHFAASLRE